MREQFIQPKVEENERPETRVEKLFGDLKEQYIQQLRLLNIMGLIEILPDSDSIGFVDVEGNEQVLPGYDEILELLESMDHLERKFNQGYNQLQITPFGLSVEVIANRVGELLKSKANQGEVQSVGFGENPNPGEELGVSQEKPVVFHYSESDEFDVEQFLYYPDFPLYLTKRNFLDPNITGWLKTDLLKKSKKFSGYNLMLVRADAEVPLRGDGNEDDDWYENQRGVNLDVLAMQERNEQYFTLEDQLVYFSSQLAMNNHVLDDRDSGQPTSVQLGTYLPVGSQYSFTFWDREDRALYLSKHQIGMGSDSEVSRAGVPINEYESL